MFFLFLLAGFMAFGHIPTQFPRSGRSRLSRRIVHLLRPQGTPHHFLPFFFFHFFVFFLSLCLSVQLGPTWLSLQLIDHFISTSIWFISIDSCHIYRSESISNAIFNYFRLISAVIRLIEFNYLKFVDQKWFQMWF